MCLYIHTYTYISEGMMYLTLQPFFVQKCNHAEIYKEISDENLELMRERLMETVIWPSDDTNTEKIG